MIHDYLDSFVVGVNNNEPVDLMDIATDETEKIKQYIRNRLSTETYADATYHAPYRSLDGLQAYLKEEYRDYYVTLFETYGDNSHSSSYTVDKSDGAIQVYASDNIPYRNYDSWFIIISSVSFTELQSSPSLLDSEMLVAFGVNFLSSDDDDGDGDGDGDGGGGDYDDDDEEIIFYPSDPSEFVESAIADGIDVTEKIADRSKFLTEMFNTGVSEKVTSGIYTINNPLSSFELTLKPEYQNYIHMVYRVYDFGDYIAPVDTYQGTGTFNFNGVIPYNNDGRDDHFVFMLIPFTEEEMEELEELENPYEYMWVFGITFRMSGDGDDDDDDSEIDLPPETINPTELDSTQYVRVLDGTTLAEYSIVPDVYNVKISQQINGLHTLTFNLLPYINASNIYTPRIIEVDNDYFHVQQITKRHELQNLEMDVLCEHVSYELNYPPTKREIVLESVSTMSTSNSDDEYEWTEDTYEGTAREILEELLYNSNSNRFSIGLVEDNGYYLFKTKAAGFRTRINELAEFVGLEVKWNKFTVALLRKRGHDNGLVFEVGKNIVGLTEVIDTVRLGKVKRSYELDVIDLNYVKDELENPLETHNISLGDIVTIIDEQYRISRKDRVVGLTRDPFEKALPTIEFTNTMGSFTGNNKSETGGAAIDLPIYQENIDRDTNANAFGLNVVARNYSFAEGDGSTALGTSSHAEGKDTLSLGTYSHAEGGWCDAVGYTAHAEGYRTLANGNYSHSEGYDTRADGNYSHAQGISTKATGDGSHSTGGSTTASGLYSYASGYGCIASGYVARATGYYTQATNHYSSAKGWNTVASEVSAQASGYDTQATARFSQASGIHTVASGEQSSAFGYGTLADRGNAFAIGKFNKPFWSTGTSNWATWDYTDVFVIGNGGSDANRSNAFKVNYNGHVYTQGAYNTTGADYSEYFEWADGNPDNEERYGHVVTLEGDKIRLASSDDNYILGVISVNPSVIGNSYNDQWQGMYVTDEWGNIQYHYIDLPHDEIDDNGNVVVAYRQSYVPVINPDYDHNTPYVPRSQRPEWSTVGMLGKLLVRDDGSCKINKYAEISETVDGILTHSEARSQFFVLRRVNENLVEVLIK